MPVDWQPIKTAPENVAVLVYDPLKYSGEGAWSYWNEERPLIHIAIQKNGNWRGDLVEFESGWESIGSYTVTQDFYPTHWMPLPPIPERT